MRPMLATLEPKPKMSSELKPCPLCQSINLGEWIHGIHYTDKHIDFVGCKDCGCQARKEAWQNRATAQHPAVEVLKRIKEEIHHIKHPPGCEGGNWGCPGCAIEGIIDKALTSQIPAETSEKP